MSADTCLPGASRNGAAVRASPVVVITGASSGIGEATAYALAERGYRLVLGARREDRLQIVAERASELSQLPAIYQHCDVRQPAEVQSLLDLALERFHRIDVVVCNAGKGLYGRIEDTSPDAFRDLIETNLLGTHNALRAAIPLMRRQRCGHLVVVGSVVGKVSWPYHGPYAATKFALSALTQTLRSELVGSGVHVSFVLPMSTRTEFFESAAAVGWQPRPLGFVQSPEQVAARIARTIARPKAEVNMVPGLNVAYVAATAFPRLVDIAGRWFYKRSRQRMARESLDAGQSTNVGLLHYRQTTPPNMNGGREAPLRE